MSKKISYLKILFLSASISTSGADVVFSQTGPSQRSFISEEIVDPVEMKDMTRFLEELGGKFLRISIKLENLLESGPDRNLNDVSEKASQLLLEGKTIVLETEMIERIESQTNTLKVIASGLVAPDLLLLQGLEHDFVNANINTREAAHSEIERRYQEYKSHLDFWKRNKEIADILLSEADASFRAVQKLEETLHEINSSWQGLVINGLAGQKLQWMEFDTRLVGTGLFGQGGQVAERMDSARRLSKVLERGILKMTKNLGENSYVLDIVSAQRVRDRIIHSAKSENIDYLSGAESLLSEGRSQLESANREIQKGSQLKTVSPAQQKIERIMEGVRFSNQQTAQAVRKLLLEAEQLNNDADKYRKLQQFVGGLSLVAGMVSSQVTEDGTEKTYDGSSDTIKRNTKFMRTFTIEQEGKTLLRSSETIELNPTLQKN